MQPSGGSSDEERNEVIQEDLPDPAPEVAHQDRHQDVQNRTNFPCLFFSYLPPCATGRLCEFSHSIHADKVRVPSAPTRRGTARRRIQRRVERHFSTANLYDVHTALQREAENDQYARVLISILELTSGGPRTSWNGTLDMLGLNFGRHPHTTRCQKRFKHVQIFV